MLFDRASRSLGDHGCKEAAVLLSAPTTQPVSHVYLHCNSISSLGAEYLAAALLCGPGPADSMTKLCLHENDIGDSGACSLFAAMRRSQLPDLVRLDLSGNRVGDRGASVSAVPPPEESRPFARSRAHRLRAWLTLVAGTRCAD